MWCVPGSISKPPIHSDTEVSGPRALAQGPGIRRGERSLLFLPDSELLAGRHSQPVTDLTIRPVSWLDGKRRRRSRRLPPGEHSLTYAFFETIPLRRMQWTEHEPPLLSKTHSIWQVYSLRNATTRFPDKLYLRPSFATIASTS